MVRSRERWLEDTLEFVYAKLEAGTLQSLEEAKLIIIRDLKDAPPSFVPLPVPPFNARPFMASYKTNPLNAYDQEVYGHSIVDGLCYKAPEVDAFVRAVREQHAATQG